MGLLGADDVIGQGYREEPCLADKVCGSAFVEHA